LNESNQILNQISSRKGQIAILIDPEKCANHQNLLELLKKAFFANVDYLFVGGSTVTREQFSTCVEFINKNSKIPLVIFTGNKIIHRIESIKLRASSEQLTSTIRM
jgi:putative glycerol-1-phosphate prenyltransferase